ncbi:MAG: ATP synthase F1 subunit delta [Spirochaetes bacterium]|nr:MAG: ATP synthase F1 subunit delta [Spirochaetota bacterium]
MSGRLVVKRYVHALFDVAEEASVLDEVKGDVAILAKILAEAPQIRNYCLSPHNNRSEEKEFVETAFVPYLHEFTGRMILVFCENGRLAGIPLIPAAFSELLEIKGDTISAVLESAAELSPETIDEIVSRLEKHSGEKVRMEARILPKLLGGFRITRQNRILDLSVSGRIKKLRMLLKQG